VRVLEFLNEKIVTGFPDADEIDLRLGGAMRKLKQGSASPFADKFVRKIFYILRKQRVSQDRHAETMVPSILR